MKGSFDDPPIMIRQSRVTLSFNIVVYALLVLAFAAAVTYPASRLFPPGYETGQVVLRVVLYAGLVFFSVLAAFAVLSLAVPAVLRIEPDGLTYKTLWTRRRLTWNDIERFDVRRGGNEIVFYNLSQSYLWDHPDTGSPLVWLDMKWEENAGEVAVLLNSARAKWSEDRSPRIVNPIPQGPPSVPKAR